jgi:hypothetical protein
LFIEWQEGTPGDIPIDGYIMHMVEIATGEVSLVYNGARNPDVYTYSINNLITGAYYSVYVQAVNFNGVSHESEEAVFVVCLAPTHIDRPDYVTSTRSSFTLSWTKPDYTGGCPILSYAVYMHDGETGSVFAQQDQTDIENRPYITQHTFEGLSYTGNTYKWKVEVINEIGSIQSLPLAVTLAAVPDAPSDFVR